MLLSHFHVDKNWKTCASRLKSFLLRFQARCREPFVILFGREPILADKKALSSNTRNQFAPTRLVVSTKCTDKVLVISRRKGRRDLLRDFRFLSAKTSSEIPRRGILRVLFSSSLLPPPFSCYESRPS